MCGIAGVVRFAGGGSCLETLRAMGRSLSHRGPDAEGFLEDLDGLPSASLVHRRLSIIDLSPTADQPLANEDGSVHAMLNGEIYNFRELRSRFEARHSFRSQGDTEAIVHGYEELGDGIVAELDGMFALALWDRARRRLLLARDPFGKKPLYYWQGQGRFVFGSEIKALLAAGVPPEMAEENLPEYLAFGYVPTPRTLFRGIKKLPPASMLSVDASGPHEPRQYWDLSFPPPAEVRPVSLDEAAERVRILMTEAVRKRLVADVPLGVLLSGGVDSSAVAALMTRLVRGTVKTFTVGFEGDAYYDERPHAEFVASHLGTEHHASVVRPEAAALVEALLDHHDEPFGDSSALPTYLVAREARRHVTVALNGDGGDEVFGGYDRFWAALLADRMPRGGRRLLAAAAGWLPDSGPHHGRLRRLRRFAAKAARCEEERIFAWSTFFDLPALAELLPGALDRDRILSSYRMTLARVGDRSLLSRLLYLNARTYLLDDLLPKMDRMTMAHALEARSPFLDKGLAEYAASLPDAFKRSGRRGKIVLKRAFEEMLPKPILARPKHGFGVPLGDWFRKDLKAMTQDILLEGSRLDRFLKPGAALRLVEEHLTGRKDCGHQLWTLLTLELWLRKHRFA